MRARVWRAEDVTPRPERVYSAFNCRSVPEHQVSHCGILERNYEIIIYGTQN